MPDAAQLLTTAEVAAFFNVSVATVGRWVREGVVEGIRTPKGRIRIRRSELDRLLAPSATEAAS